MLKRSKKTKFIAFAFALVASVSAVPATNASAYYLIGDVNQDGMVDATDASAVLSYYAAVSCGESAYICTDVADIDGDGFVDATDASRILSYYADLSVGKQAVWPERLHNHDKVTLKPGYKWTIKEWPDFSSETTAFISENDQVYILDKDVFSDWYQVEFNDKAIGYINVTDPELAEYFIYEDFKGTSTTTAISDTVTTTTSVTTTSVTTTSVTTTSKQADTETTTTSKDEVTTPTTTIPSDTEKTHMCKLEVKPGYTWGVKSSKDVDSDTVYMVSNEDSILTVTKSGNWYYVLVNEQVTGYMNITDVDMEKYFERTVLGPVA